MASSVVPLSPIPELPTDDERRAYLLAEVQGLSDDEIGRLLRVRRETANRWRGACRRKLDRLRADWPEVAGPIIDAITATQPAA
ncbi:MAG TPA: hypothetical protein VF796_27520 [Humisphaera sp.]